MDEQQKLQITVTSEEHTFILAALRVVQGLRTNDENGWSDWFARMEHFEGKQPLDNDEVDALCENINCVYEVVGEEPWRVVMQDVVNSADDTGCGGGITVVDLDAINRMSNFLDGIEDDEDEDEDEE